jgi:hypothetical protein
MLHKMLCLEGYNLMELAKEIVQLSAQEILYLPVLASIVVS